jgi:hypothetical protein
MKKIGEITQINQVTDHIFISGILPLEINIRLLKELKIKYILCCVDQLYVADIHNKILLDNPDITILYLPYDDDIYQNLWTPNQNAVKMISYLTNSTDHQKLSQMLSLYQNKPLIEIGYHFIDNAVGHNQNILVHCMAGVSRSASMVIYYLMKKNHWSFIKAFSTVQNARSIAKPNDSFRAQLAQYGINRDGFTESGAQNIIKKLKA